MYGKNVEISIEVSYDLIEIQFTLVTTTEIYENHNKFYWIFIENFKKYLRLLLVIPKSTLLHEMSKW